MKKQHPAQLFRFFKVFNKPDRSIFSYFCKNKYITFLNLSSKSLSKPMMVDGLASNRDLPEMETKKMCDVISKYI